MRIVVAPDKFRGTIDAAGAAEQLAAGLSASGHEVVVIPMADGGEGTLEALGGANRSTKVTGPLGDVVDAAWRMSSGTAVVEMARASGLALVGGAEGNDAVAASTFGTGELVLDAVEKGARRVVVGLGGSATTDGGLGALRAMYPVQRFRGVELVVACDVHTRFVDAARVFGPQKGAGAAQLDLLERRLERLVDVYLEDYGVDVREVPGAGAAGGLAGGLLCAGATLVPGVELIADLVGLPDAVEAADLVVTGEGLLDVESFDGKVVGGVTELAADLGVPVVAVVGAVDHEGLDEVLPGGLEVVSLSDRFGRARSLSDVAGCLREVGAALP
ncbi:MAG: glycerate kinase [Actinomycetes bacterium]